jgi:hypothetical protein
VAGLLGLTFLLIAAILSWWVLVIAVPMLAISGWLAYEAMSLRPALLG